jgi:hypothetical protein
MPFYNETISPVIFGLMFLLLIIMTVCASIVQHDLNSNASIYLPDFLSSRYYYILNLSLLIIFLCFTNSVFNGPEYLSIMLILIGIIGDIFITIFTKDRSQDSYK